MKDIRIVIASFAAFVLIIPLILIESFSGLNDKNIHNSSESKEASQIETFKLYSTRSGTVENIQAVDYICGVVAAEVPVSYKDEALKAQAVASFTYACYQREYNKAHPGVTAAIKGADLSDDYHSYEAYLSREQAQAEWGNSFETNWNRIYQAVNAVKNKVITYSGQPILAAFFSTSSGITESSKDVWDFDLPYLTEVNSEWDKSASDYESKAVLKMEDVKAKISQKYPKAVFNADHSKWITGLTRSAAGGVLTANLCGNPVSGSDIRSLFSLKSTNFDISYQSGSFTFDVKGNGHGVGMSQNGAEYLAVQGKTWEDIIKWYYKGVAISDYDWKK